MRGLEGKVAIVTGASRGIGRAIALRLASEGASVVVNYRGQTGAAEDAVAEIHSSSGQAVALQADVSDPAAAERLAAQTLTRFGRIDVLINNAGLMYRSDVFHFNPDE